MNLELRDKIAIVTGASRGIGFAIASALAREGCRLALCARGEGDLRRAARELEAEHGAEVLVLALDVAEPDAADRLIGATAESFGGVDVLVNNVGTGHRKPFADTGEDDWTRMLEVNFRSGVRMSRAAIPHLRRRGGGAILFVASIWGRESGPPGLSLYTATKSAMVSLAKSMAAELAADRIRVLSIAPGSIRFPGGSWDRRVQADPEGMEEFVRENIPLGRFGRREEVADLAAFLVSPRASLLTGACINVDGGQSRSLI